MAKNELDAPCFADAFMAAHPEDWIVSHGVGSTKSAATASTYAELHADRAVAARAQADREVTQDFKRLKTGKAFQLPAVWRGKKYHRASLLGVGKSCEATTTGVELLDRCWVIERPPANHSGSWQ